MPVTPAPTTPAIKPPEATTEPHQPTSKKTADEKVGHNVDQASSTASGQTESAHKSTRTQRRKERIRNEIAANPTAFRLSRRQKKDANRVAREILGDKYVRHAFTARRRDQ